MEKETLDIQLHPSKMIPFLFSFVL